MGAANNSASQALGHGVATYVTPNNVAVGLRSVQWYSGGSFSLRQIPQYHVRGSAFTDIAGFDTPSQGLVRGRTYTMVVTFRMLRTQGFFDPSARSIQFYTEVGAPYTATVQAVDKVDAQELRLTFTVPPTGWWYLRLCNGGMVGDPDTWWDDMLIVEGAWSGPAFNGSTPDAPGKDYAWTGTPNASTSTYVATRSASLLFIREDNTGVVEHFDCVLQTKNYNFELSSNFKRLFWWGVDAIFRGQVTGQAIPIVYAQKPTWGQLLAQGVTWGDLLNGTWGSPLSVPVEVETDYSLGNVGSTRKFVKFRKGLRFRQIGFRVTFPVDGTTLTLPVYVFSLTAHVVTRETVVKAIS
jgi:hypothetical protein